MNLNNIFPGGAVSALDKTWHEDLTIVCFVGGDRVIGIRKNDDLYCTLTMTPPQIRQSERGLHVAPPLLLPYDGISAPRLTLSPAGVAYTIRVVELSDKAAEYFMSQSRDTFEPPQIVVPKGSSGLVGV